MIDSSGLWLIAALAAHEQHPGGAEPADDHRIVPGARRQETRRDADRLDRARQPGDDARIADEGVGFMRLGQAGPDAAPRGDRLNSRSQIGERGRAARVVRRAKVDGKLHMTRNDIGRARPDFHPPDGGDEIGLSSGARLDRQRHLRSGRQGVAAERHRRRAGVACRAVHADFEPRRAVDGGNDPDRQPFRLEDRTLFDMRLDEGGDVRRANRTGLLRIAAERLQSVAHGDPGGVLLVERVLRVGSGKRARTGQRQAEAHALFVAEGDDFDGVPEPFPGRGERLDHGERGERAVIAVVAAGVAHRVDMRAQHQRRRAGALALVARDDVAGRVDPRLEPGLRAPTDKGLGCAPVRLGEKEPRQTSRLVGEGRKGVETRHQLRAGGEIGVGKASRHHLSAKSSFSQRASTARSSSVIWL